MSDIPGNRPEDLVVEAQADAVYEIFPECSDEQMEKVLKLFNQEFESGYGQARSDAAEEQHYKEMSNVRD